MANVSNLESRLIQIIEQNEPVAIALTGEWGIGKTHFWKNFYERRHQDLKLYAEKYAYVSLFGIDSLETLKYEIAVNSHDTVQKKDYLSGVKSCFSYISQNIKLPDMESNGFTMSISQSMINSLIGSSIQNTLICIDDFERKSDKLAVKDIMGVINDLKEQKNCKVVVILHSDKLNSEFAEYKEKVFDDVLVLDDNLELLKEIIRDDESFNTYKSFYDCLKIKNLRFYKQVHKDYIQLLKQLNCDMSYNFKYNVLFNLLIIQLVRKFNIQLKYGKQQLEFKVDISFLAENKSYHFRDINLFNEEKEKIQAFNKYLNGFHRFYEHFSFSKNNSHLNITGKHVLKYVNDYEITSDFINEARFGMRTDTEWNKIIPELSSLNHSEQFIQNFYDFCLKDHTWFGLTEFNHTILKNKNRQMAESYYNEQCKYIAAEFNQITKFIYYESEQEMNQNNEDLIFPNQDEVEVFEASYFGISSKSILYSFLISEIEKHNNELINLNLLSYADRIISGDVYFAYPKDIQKICNRLTKSDLKQMIWEGNDTNKMSYIKAIVMCNTFSPKKRSKIRQWIIELLHEKIQENPHSKAVILTFLEFTDNLTQFPKSLYYY